MADRQEEQLLGYLLDALDESGEERLKEQLASDPTLRHQLARLRAALRPLEPTREVFEPPEQLAERTCRFVARAGVVPDAAVASVAPQQAAAPMSPVEPPVDAADTVGPPSWASSWGWKDLAAAAAILVAATLLVVPAIENSRFNARVEVCADNLRLLGRAMAQYSQQQEGYFPPVAQEGRLAAAGSFAPVLASAGYIQSPRWLVCPASSLAEDREFRIPSVEEVLSTDDPVELNRFQRRMGGSYGYNLGFMENGHYHSPRNLRRASFALMSDAPSNRLPGHQSLNHGGRGQNVLFEDSHVRFVTSPDLDELPDPFFINDAGQVAAGRGRDDAVIAGSGSPPLRYVGFGGR